MATKVRTKTRRIFVRRSFRRKQKLTIPLAIIGGLAPGVIEAKRYYDATNPNSGFSGKLSNIAISLSQSYAGYNPEAKKFSLEYMKTGTFPLILGMIVHYVVGSRLGVNRMLGRMGVPFVRI